MALSREKMPSNLPSAMSLAKYLPFCGIIAMALTAPLTAQPTAPAPAAPPTEQAAAEENPFLKLVHSLSWTTNGEGTVGSHATIKVPEGYRFTSAEGTLALMKANGNLTSGHELGYLTPDDLSWYAMFEFKDTGYVKDDEKDNLKPDELLQNFRDGQAQANSKLVRNGMPTLIIEGWQTPPFYNPETKNLEWALRLRSSDGGQFVNYKTNLLGRRGVMEVVLVCDETQLATVIPQYQKLLTGFTFKKEESYAAFQKGDKIAEYGLTGLIAGGGLLVAAKTGLLAKLGKFLKPIIIGVVAVFAGIAKLFGFKKKETV